MTAAIASDRGDAESFVLPITPSMQDMDELGHVSNVVYVEWLQRAAIAHAAALGYDCDVFRSLGGLFAVRRHEIEYLQSAYASVPLEIESWVEVWKQASSVRKSIIRRACDGGVIARASTLWAFVSLTTGRPTRIPAEIPAAFRSGRLHVHAAAGSPPAAGGLATQTRQSCLRRQVGPRPRSIRPVPWHQQGQ